MIWLLIAAGLGLLSLAHLAPFPFLLEAVAPAPALWQMPPDEASPSIYLTFDDGPNPTATPELLDVLARHGASATFFLIDRHLNRETAPIVRRMFAEGHAVGLHSHTRALMLMTPTRLAGTLTAAAARIERLEVFWPTTGETQSFTDVPVDRIIRIVEGETSYSTLELTTVEFGKRSAN